MNILFLLYFDITDTSQVGVAKKVRYQINAMRFLEHSVDLAYCKDGKLLIERENLTVDSFDAPCGKSHYRKSVRNIISKIAVNYHMVLIRFPGSIDFYTYQTFKKASARGAKVVLEMPTYPIGGEMQNILRQLKSQRNYIQYIKRVLVYSCHKVLSRRISKYVSCILSYTTYDSIWRTKVINIENGIDCDAISVRSIHKESDNTINLIFVAVFAIWHGLDRIIDGLNQYYNKKTTSMPDVFLTLIGRSEELDNIVSSNVFLNVKSHVNVLGPRYGADLDKEYNKADIAISSLGMHRIGLKQGSTLKTREYCAKGIPFVYGYEERGIDESFPYALRVPSNDEPIDILKIIEFYYRISGKNYAEEMHDFSKKYDWKNQMKIFFDEFSKIEG